MDFMCRKGNPVRCGYARSYSGCCLGVAGCGFINQQRRTYQKRNQYCCAERARTSNRSRWSRSHGPAFDQLLQCVVWKQDLALKLTCMMSMGQCVTISSSAENGSLFFHDITVMLQKQCRRANSGGAAGEHSTARHHAQHRDVEVGESYCCTRATCCDPSATR